MSNTGRIWSDQKLEAEHNKVDQPDANVQAAQAFSLDMTQQSQEVELSRMQRKMKRLFGSGKATSGLFLTGFQMGALVGGAFGGLIGVYQAYQMRSFAIIPMSMIGSGVSFGFFMGLGMTFRSGSF